MIPNKKSPTGSIETTMRDLGTRLARVRLSRNLTQARLAQEAGASLPSIKRLEAGRNSSLDTLLRVLRALNLGDRILDILPNPDVRPVERVQHDGHERRRARTQTEAPKKASDWAWVEEDEQ
ncbi:MULTISPECIES: helix-turn-helix domain-containing protein [Agrobacterium tumefaciens complex]|uniref:helix-turn-helix domain-containing protein n=1 Tax=Agrobacterium tumefaciens complex TaxID=1183400 RepID=UPI0009BAE2FD|nr:MULTISPECIES: helix-turn-helix transcriptional regulator [Agrobacterium tumefaciens complex]QCL92364.1 helix-turn-helix transcriptional regulator [Agrobacterium tumefaciens]